MARILLYTSANEKPTGGNKIVYRHVAILRELGFDAYVLHPRPGFRYEAFSHATPVLAVSELVLRPDDVVVLPEDGGIGLRHFARGVRKVLFNQNAYYSFRGFEDLEGMLPPYLDPEFVATLVVSQDNRRYIEYAFPGVHCRRIHLSLDLERFAAVPLAEKHDHIAFMTRKNHGDVVQVLQILRSRAVLGSWRLTPIEDQDEAGVARILGEAKIFLAFGHPEGISLSNLEALARGCRVIGYSGMGCREYFAADRCREIETGDVVAFARAVEAEIARFDAGGPWPAQAATASARYVQERFSPAAERADLLDFYGGLLGGS